MNALAPYLLAGSAAIPLVITRETTVWRAWSGFGFRGIVASLLPHVVALVAAIA